jgi:hypothetical protein
VINRLPGLKPPVWRTLIYALFMGGVVVAALNMLDVVGAGTQPPWLFASPPWLGRWGAFFSWSDWSNSRSPITVLSVDEGGPAERADVCPGDRIDVGDSENAAIPMATPSDRKTGEPLMPGLMTPEEIWMSSDVREGPTRALPPIATSVASRSILRSPTG